MNIRKIANKLFIYFIMIIIACITVGPFLITLFMSLKSPSEGIFESILPEQITLSNYIDAFEKASFGQYLLNTVIATAMAVPLNLLFSSLAAYPLARMDFKGRQIVLTLIISTMMVPFQLYMAPLFQLTGNLGLRNTYFGLIILQISTAFGIYLMRQSYISIPKELEESALIDGANRFQVWWKIVLPLSKPTLISLAIYTFTFTWGDYLWPLLNITTSDMNTISIGLAKLSQNFDGANMKLVSAASILSTIPTLLIFIALQKYFVGTTDGALKG